MASIRSSVSIVVNVRDRDPYEFSFIAHQTSSREERLIQPAFYEKSSVEGCVPEGDHIEVEILTPWITPSLAEGIHVYVNPDNGRRFVCYTPKLPAMEEARAMLVLWSVGTVFTLITGRDFVPELAEGTDVFMTRMQEEYGITASFH